LSAPVAALGLVAASSVVGAVSSLPPALIVGGALVAGSALTGGRERVADTIKEGKKARAAEDDSYHVGDISRGLLAKGRAGTGRTGYKFGDFSKGVVRHFTGSSSEPEPEPEPGPEPEPESVRAHGRGRGAAETGSLGSPPDGLGPKPGA
jgi:hypothetical protein